MSAVHERGRDVVGRYLIRRVLQFIPVFLGATFWIFALVFLIPGDPIRALSGDKPMPISVQQALRGQYHLDKPLWQQYALYVGGVVQGDFGQDFRGREVTEIMGERIPVITFLGVDLGALMGGAIITEAIFNLPGIGNAVFSAVLRQEGTVVVGIVTFLVLIFMISNLVVDLLYAVLDPRIRYE